MLIVSSKHALMITNGKERKYHDDPFLHTAKPKLNVGAKPFVFNPNAKTFVPPGGGSQGAPAIRGAQENATQGTGRFDFLLCLVFRLCLGQISHCSIFCVLTEVMARMAATTIDNIQSPGEAEEGNDEDDPLWQFVFHKLANGDREKVSMDCHELQEELFPCSFYFDVLLGSDGKNVGES